MHQVGFHYTENKIECDSSARNEKARTVAVKTPVTLNTHTHTHYHARARARALPHAHARTHTRTRTHTHTHAHTHTQTGSYRRIHTQGILIIFYFLL